MIYDLLLLEACWEVDELTPECPPIAPWPRPPKPLPPPLPFRVSAILPTGFILDTGEVVTEETYAVLHITGQLG